MFNEVAFSHTTLPLSQPICRIQCIGTQYFVKFQNTTFLNMGDVRLTGYDMPAINVSEDSKRRVDKIKEHIEWNVSNRDVADKAIEKLEEEIVPEQERIDSENTDN